MTKFTRRKLGVMAAGAAVAAALPTAAAWRGEIADVSTLPEAETIIGKGGDLNAAIAALPDGWTLRSEPGAKWWVAGGLVISGKSGITVDMDGADWIEIRGEHRADFSIRDSSYCTVKNCMVGSPPPGGYSFDVIGARVNAVLI